MGKKRFCNNKKLFKIMVLFIQLPFSEPATDDWLTIKVYDYDQTSSDDLVGVCSIKKQDILEGKVTFFSIQIIFNLFSIKIIFG